ncbi:hypothetical protein [Arthrobacter monumenti]
MRILPRYATARQRVNSFYDLGPWIMAIVGGPLVAFLYGAVTGRKNA